jgi:putative transcriptional regulator
MTAIQHHIPAELVRAYVAGRLAHGYALVVAAHVSMCDDCRALLAAEEMAAGAVLELQRPEADAASSDLRDRVLAALDGPAPAEDAGPTPRMGVYPGPVAQALKGRAPRWRHLGAGIRQAILHADAEGSARLLWIPQGKAVPDHVHKGLELTMVLQGSFRDETGRFGVGDVEVADASLEHTPIAEPGETCICLAATDAPLRFQGLVPRLLQPLFRI